MEGEEPDGWVTIVRLAIKGRSVSVRPFSNNSDFFVYRGRAGVSGLAGNESPGEDFTLDP